MQTSRKSLRSFFEEFTLTPGQEAAVDALNEFLLDPLARCLLLKGYAGTGKTFLLKGIADFLASQNRCFRILAPTGRAAKVARERTQHPASTIHRAIYSFDKLVEAKPDEDDPDSFKFYYEVSNLADKKTDVTILVDESSMISDRKSETEFLRFGSGRLLHDLIEASRLQVPGLKARIVFVGDPAQLPPVTDGAFSPALSAEYLFQSYEIEAKEVEMTDLVRQTESSAIAEKAKVLRDSIRENKFFSLDLSGNNEDIKTITEKDVADCCLYGNEGRKPREDTICLAYTNKTVMEYNKYLRSVRFGSKEDVPVQVGDRLLVVCNSAGYSLFNGDMVEVQAVLGEPETRIVKKQPLTFRKLRICMSNDAGERITQECMILENLLNSGDRDITREEQQALYIDFKIRHPDLKANTEEFRLALRNDPYFQALKVKYGYAITCHKAQGGEWDRAVVVFENRVGWDNAGWFRWCYTAITRAKTQLFTINPPSIKLLSNIKVLETNATSVPDVDPDVLVQCKLEEYRKALVEHGMELTRFEQHKEKWLIRLHLAKDKKQICLQLNYNKKGIFKNPQYIGDVTDAKELSEKALALWEQSGLAASRDTAIPERMDFSGVHPALKQLYENVAAILAANDFTLLELRHLEYRERYRVAYGKARVQMDFLYNNKGQVPILSFAPEPGCEKSDLDHVKNVVTQALYGADSTPEKRQEAPHV